MKSREHAMPGSTELDSTTPTLANETTLDAFNPDRDRWEITSEESERAYEFIRTAMPVWREVHREILLSFVKPPMLRGTKRWLVEQLVEISKRKGSEQFSRSYSLDTLEPEDTIGLILFKPRSSKAVIKLAGLFIMSGARYLNLYAAASVSIGDDRLSFGTLLILTSLRYALSQGFTSLTLSALNNTVAVIYATYGYELTGQRNPFNNLKEMHIADIEQAYAVHELSTREVEAVRKVNLFLEKHTPELVYEQLKQAEPYVDEGPDIQSSDFLDQVLEIYEDILMPMLREVDKRPLSVKVNDMAVRMPNDLESNYKAWYALGLNIVTVKDLRHKFKAIAKLLSVMYAQNKDITVIAMIPETCYEKNFLATMLFLGIFLKWTRYFELMKQVYYCDMGNLAQFKRSFQPGQRALVFVHVADFLSGDITPLLERFEKSIVKAYPKNAVYMLPAVAYCTQSVYDQFALQVAENRLTVNTPSTSRFITGICATIVPTVHDIVHNLHDFVTEERGRYPAQASSTMTVFKHMPPEYTHCLKPMMWVDVFTFHSNWLYFDAQREFAHKLRRNNRLEGKQSAFIELTE